MSLTPPPSAPPAAPTAPGDAPSRANPSTFRALADAFVAWQATFRDSLADLRTWLADYITWAGTNITEMDALQADVTEKANTATTKASDASDSADAASDSASAAADSRTAIDNRLYPGTYASDPTTRPDGSSIQEGDEYTNSTVNLRKVYAGGVWIVPEINAAALAASSGASLVGDGDTTIADRLSAINLADYTALRAYAGLNKSAYITGYLASANPSGIAGLFTRDDTDTTSADNGGTIIVASNGKRWKRVFSGAVDVRWFGAKGDGESHPLSEMFASLLDAKAVYPHAVALTDQIDWAAFQAAVNHGGAVTVGTGIYLANRKIVCSVYGTRIYGPATDWSGDVAMGASLRGHADLADDFLIEFRSTSPVQLRSVGMMDVGIDLVTNSPDCGGLAVYGAYDGSNFGRINITGVALNRIGFLATAGTPETRTGVTQTATFDSIWVLKRAGVSTVPAIRTFGVQESAFTNCKASHTSATCAAWELISCRGTKLTTPSFVNPSGYGLDIIENHDRNEGITIDTPTFENCLNTVRSYSTDAYTFGPISVIPALGDTVRQPADGSAATGTVWQASAAGVYAKNVSGTFTPGTLYNAAGVPIGTITFVSLFGNRSIRLVNPRTLGGAAVGGANGGSFKALRNSYIELPDDSSTTYSHAYTVDDTAINNQFVERRKGQMYGPGRFNGVQGVGDIRLNFPTNWPWSTQTVRLTNYADAKRITVTKTTAASFLSILPTTDTVNEYGTTEIRLHQGSITFVRTGATTWNIESASGRVFVVGTCRLSTLHRSINLAASLAADTNSVDGATITNTGAAGIYSVNLSAVGDAVTIGTRFTLVRVANQALRVKPNAADIILGASAAGKYLELSAAGSSVTLECVAAGTYAVVASSGTYSFEA